LKNTNKKILKQMEIGVLSISLVYQIKMAYIMSSVFYLTNRLAKSAIGLAEFDHALSKIEKIEKISLEQKENQELYEGFKQDLDDILLKYF
jgi:hypothetical protein